jgi:hypothetical protein
MAIMILLKYEHENNSGETCLSLNKRITWAGNPRLFTSPNPNYN